MVEQMAIKRWKGVLIKSILLAFPTYVMSNFLLLLEICENLASAIAQFWWSSNPPKEGLIGQNGKMSADHGREAGLDSV